MLTLTDNADPELEPSEAARVVFAGMPRGDAEIRNSKPGEAQKFDLKVET